MSKYIPRPGHSDRRIVRRSSVLKDVSRGRPRAVVRRVSAPYVRRRTFGTAAPVAGHLRGLARFPMGIRIPRKATRALAVAAVFAMLVSGVAYGWRSSLLKVHEVEVVGARTVPVEDIQARAGLIGEHIVTAHLGRAQQSVAALPLVRSVRAERKWPNTVVLRVEERQPWATWDQAGVRYAIDRDGVVLGVYAAPQGRPFIISADPVSLRQGDRVSYQAVDAVAEIYELLPRQLGTGVAQVAFVPGKGVQVVTERGEVAILGDSSSIGYKLAVWSAAEAEARRQQINYQVIDLRWGNRPVLQ